MNLVKNQSYFFNEDLFVGIKDIPDHSIYGHENEMYN